MRRLLLQQLSHWKIKADRKPLILMGVRQTGKTYLLEQFGKQHFKNYHIINFERQETASKIFAEDLDPKQLITALEFYIKKPIDLKNDLLIFDEIQACPKAVTSLKYFCEGMPELALASAGSLLGLHLNETSFPVGKVDMMHLHPMTFSEFLLGINDNLAYELLQNSNRTMKIPLTAHEHCWQQLKHYFITGGLPEVVSTFAAYQQNLFTATHEVRQKQETLIKNYYADIAKHSGKVNAMSIDRTWHAIPKQLMQTLDSSAKRFRFNDILPNIKRYAQLVNVLDWLESANLVIKVPVLDTIRLPLNANTKDNLFKLLMFDIGILGAMAQLPPETLLKYDYGSYKGYFAENFVAQQVLTLNKPIFNWQEDHSEIEFIYQQADQCIPIEVKSGQIRKSQSLIKYIEKYHPPFSFVLSADTIKLTSHKAFLPLYLVEYIDRFYPLQ